MLDKLLSIVNSLKNDSSRTGKEAILLKHKDNQLFRSVLDFVYNPYIVTGISSKKIGKNSIVETNVKVNDLIQLMNYLKENNTGRLLDVAVIHSFLNTLSSEDERELVKEIATKSLKIGLTSNTINKVYGKGTIPSFAVQLAEPFSKKGDKVKGEFYVTLKLDGNRVIAIKENDKVKFFSRKGQPIEGLIQLEEHIKPLPNGFVYDGELLLVNSDNLDSADLFRATQKVVRKDGIKEDLEFYIFDTLTVKEFLDGKSNNTYKERRKKLTEFYGKTEKNQFISVLPVMYQGSDKSVIGDLMKQVVSSGYEGLMVNTADGLYQTKRTTDLQKVKEMHSADLLCISVEEGTGKNKGKLGRINVEYKENIVGVGSGFTDDERKLYFDNPDLIVGKIIEVQFFEESQDEKTNLPSLRFPVFKTVRTDKSVEDINID